MKIRVFLVILGPSEWIIQRQRVKSSANGYVCLQLSGMNRLRAQGSRLKQKLREKSRRFLPELEP
jgi:hypothetical protein